MKQILSLLLLCSIVQTALQAQDKLKLYIDCNTSGCDFNYIRQQITIADFVRDRKESDVHILIIAEQAGNRGQQFAVQFIGKGQPASQPDTLHFFASATCTENKIREKLVQVIKAGIAPFIIRRGEFEKLNISFPAEKENEPSVSTKDKWNSWNFRIGGNANFSGDKNYKAKRLGGSLSATRVTESSKLEFFLYNSSSRNKYIFEEDSQKTELITRDDYFEAEQSYVKTISPKWSWSFETALRKSSYDNISHAISGAGGIEYNIYPYSSSSSKFLVLRYMLEAVSRSYLEETIYDKTRETLISNNLGLYASFTQPWGSISSGITYYNYLDNLSNNNVSLYANVELQIFKGVSINFYGNASLISDQLHLSKQVATSQEVLLKLKALSTSYNYYTGMGISYRFGSKFNNIVNPRFTNGRN